MSETETPKCPKCGSELVNNLFDGSHEFDGSQNFDGVKCPKCSQGEPETNN